MENYNNYISSDKNIRFGRPCLTGTRIAVEDVIAWLENGMDIQTIIYDYPELNEAQIKACLEYRRQT